MKTTDKSADALTEAERLLLARVNDCTKPIDAADRNGILKLIDRLAACPVEQPAAAQAESDNLQVDWIECEEALEELLRDEGIDSQLVGEIDKRSIIELILEKAAPSPADERAARLDDADIDTIAESMPGGLDSFIKQWGWRQFARAVEDEVILNVARAASANETGAEGAAIPAGWKLVRVNEHFDALIAALERAESKGYLPDSMREEWENFACDENVTQPAQADAPAEAREPHSDDVAVDSFAAAMKHKLAQARAKGRGGWETCSPADLSRMLREHVEKGDPRDVANFCMMLWHHGSPIVSAPADSGEARLTDEQKATINWAIRAAVEAGYTADADVLRALLQGANHA